MDVELRHLRALCAIADARSITRAAAATRTTQPALAASLQRIERAIGGAVFLRGRDGVVPTAFGDQVLAGARAVLAAAEGFSDQLAGWLADSSVRPPGVGGVAGPVLIELAGLLDAAEPARGIAVSTENCPARLLDMLATRRLDAALLADHPRHTELLPSGVAARELGTEPLFLVLPTDHPAAADDEVELSRLAAEAWVLGPQTDAGWPTAFDAACLAAGFLPRRVHRVAETQSQRALVTRGRAVALCQVTFPPAPGVVVLPIAGDPLWIRHLVAWHVDGAFGPDPDALVTAAEAAYRRELRSSAAYQRWSRTRSGAELI